MNKKSLFILLLASLMLLFVFCKKETPGIQPNESETQAFGMVLEENQKVQDFLFAEETKLPDTKELSLRLSELVQKAESEFLKTSALSLQKKLESLNPKDTGSENRETYFLVFSQFSDALGSLMPYFSVSSGHYKFYCPMVEKFWISKGLAVRNPYAPEMRDCGERLP